MNLNENKNRNHFQKKIFKAFFNKQGQNKGSFLSQINVTLLQNVFPFKKFIFPFLLFVIVLDLCIDAIGLYMSILYHITLS